MKLTKKDAYEINCLKNRGRKMSTEEKYDFLINNGIVSENALNLVTMIDGFNDKTLDDALYCLTGEHSFEDFATDLNRTRNAFKQCLDIAINW